MFGGQHRNDEGNGPSRSGERETESSRNRMYSPIPDSFGGSSAQIKTPESIFGIGVFQLHLR
jgi:hypothetical protein